VDEKPEKISNEAGPSTGLFEHQMI